MFPRLGRPASAAAPPAFVIVSVSEFLDLVEVIGIPEVLSSIFKISGRGYRFFTVALLRAWYSTHSLSPPSFFFANKSGAVPDNND
jgi:hypothetical protein